MDNISTAALLAIHKIDTTSAICDIKDEIFRLNCEMKELKRKFKELEEKIDGK